VLLPVEVLGEDGTTAERKLNASRDQAESVRFLWLQVHGLRYQEQQVFKSTKANGFHCAAMWSLSLSLVRVRAELAADSPRST
jgi:hypothetical protein